MQKKCNKKIYLCFSRVRRQCVQGEKPNVFEFNDFVKMFNAVWDYNKQAKKCFSVRFVMKKIGLKSTNVIIQIKQGGLMPSYDLWKRLAGIFEFTDKEYEYSSLLLKANKSNLLDEKIDVTKKIKKMQKEQGIIIEVSRDKEPYMNKSFLWLLDIIIEATFLDNYIGSLEWFVERLGWLTTAEDIESALVFLCEKKLFAYENNLYSRVDNGYFTEFINERIQQTVSSWSSWLNKGMYQKYTVNTIPINAKYIPEINKKLLEFQSDLFEWSKDTPDKSSLIQVATVLYQVTNLVKE